MNDSAPAKDESTAIADEICLLWSQVLLDVDLPAEGFAELRGIVQLWVAPLHTREILRLHCRYPHEPCLIMHHCFFFV